MALQTLILSMENLTDRKRFRDELDDSLADSAESKLRRLDSTEPEDLLGILEDVDSVVERDGELDSFIRSFEEEIRALPAAVAEAADRNESPQPELGYLLEASDDELGLPPTVGSVPTTEAVDFTTEVSSTGLFDLGGDLGFEDEIPCYDSFEIGAGVSSGAAEEFVALGGLFDYSDVPFRPESLSAL